MQIIAKKALRDFWAKHNQAEAPLTAWYVAVDKAEWKGPADIKVRLAQRLILSAIIV